PHAGHHGGSRFSVSKIWLLQFGHSTPIGPASDCARQVFHPQRYSSPPTRSMRIKPRISVALCNLLARFVQERRITAQGHPKPAWPPAPDEGAGTMKRRSFVAGGVGALGALALGTWPRNGQ